MTTKIALYFDIESPFSYVAYELLLRHEKLWDVELVLKPVLLGVLLREAGNSPPAHVPLKGQYNIRDLRRRSALHSIPWKGLPSNSRALKTAVEPYFASLPGIRLLTAALLQHGSSDARCRKLVSKLYHCIMVEHAGKPCILADGALVPLCSTAGFSQEEVRILMAATTTPEVKHALKAATDEAAHEGAFGVPYMCVDGPGIARYHRVWFGADALPMMAHVLHKQLVMPAMSKI